MAFSSYRTRFAGTLSGVPIEELKELDYSISTFKGRLAFIKKKYKRVKPFYDSYIFTSEEEQDVNTEDGIEFYKVNLSTTDELSSEINIFKFIERDASYLLNSSDLPRDKQQEYTILDEEEFKKLLIKERKNISLNSSEVMEILKPKEENFYKDNDITISPKDLTDDITGSVLSDYNTLRNHLKKEMAKVKNKEKSVYDLGFLKRNLGTLMADMVDSKKILRGITNPSKKGGDESGMFYTDLIDYTNENHIKAILRNVKITGELEPDNELSHIAYDIEVAIKKLHSKGKLDDLDLEIVECYNSGYSERNIAEELDKGKTTIQQRLSKIVKRISEYFNKNI